MGHMHMQKVVDYQVIKAGAPQLLTTSVHQAMKNGWVPSGTIVSHHDELVQAMVKFEEA